MRAKFERILGSRDPEAFYMMDPDNNGAPEPNVYESKEADLILHVCLITIFLWVFAFCYRKWKLGNLDWKCVILTYNLIKSGFFLLMCLDLD